MFVITVVFEDARDRSYDSVIGKPKIEKNLMAFHQKGGTDILVNLDKVSFVEVQEMEGER